MLLVFAMIIGKSNNKHWPENRLKHDQKSQTRNRNDSSMTSMCKRILTGIIKLTGTMKPSSLLFFLPLSFTMSVNWMWMYSHRNHGVDGDYKTASLLSFLPLSFTMSASSSAISFLGTYPYHTLAALFLGFVLFKQLNKGRNGNPNGLPLPPGPKGYPLIGNLFDIPVDKAWLVYDEWRKTYGRTFIIYKYYFVTESHFRWYNVF